MSDWLIIWKEREKQRYMHFYIMICHYAYGICEKVKFAPSRRAIMSWYVYRKSFSAVIPPKKNSIQHFVMSENSRENGSSSMASVCGSTMFIDGSRCSIKNLSAGIAAVSNS
jgi:polyribonucleotide nucleotidyltransferase